VPPPAHSPLAQEHRELRTEAQYLVGQLRGPTTSEEDAIRRTLANYPALTEDEVRSWWRVGEFRDQVREAREVAAEYAHELAAEREQPRSRFTTETDPFSVPAGQTVADFLSRVAWRH
jgi:hypothetical protein